MICSLAYFFLIEVEPSNWEFVFTGWFAVVAGVTAWILASVFAALSFLVIPWLLFKISKPQTRLIMLPFVLVLAEIIRSYLFSIVSYGDGGSIGSSFNWGSLAVISSSLPIVFASRMVGFYGMTIIAALISLGLYLLTVGRKPWRASIYMLIAVTVICVGYYKTPKAIYKDRLHIVAVHLNESDAVSRWGDFSILPNNIDVLLLPEYSEVRHNKHFNDALAKLTSRGIIVTTELKGESPKASNDLIYINKQGAVISRQAKHKLIPAGEYMPNSLRAAFKILGKQDSVNLFKYSQQLQPGESAIQKVENEGIIYGALPCSGVLSPGEYRIMTNQGANLLLNPASLALLKQNSKFHVYARRMARYQAVYNGRYFVQASRSGESYIIDSSGAFRASSRGEDTQVIELNLQRNLH